MLCDKYYKKLESGGRERGDSEGDYRTGGVGVRQVGRRVATKREGKSVNQAERGGKLLRSLMAYFPPRLLSHWRILQERGKRNVHCTVNVNEQEADK